MKKVLFGAGMNAQTAIDIIGKSNIAYIVDNDEKKDGMNIGGIDVFSFENKKEELHKYKVIISVSEKYREEIEHQLFDSGIDNFCSFRQIQREQTRQKIANRKNGLEQYRKAVEWIKRNSVNGEGIICNTGFPVIYPEVTGYYIPTLIRWGYRDLAKKYANWLISHQQKDGSWLDASGNAPYIFDSAQIIKGLLAVRKIVDDTESVDKSILAGCEWIFSRMSQEYRLITPNTQCWGEDEATCSEIIHIYCLSPLKEAGIAFNKPHYVEYADKVFEYYKTKYIEKIMNFSLLSHFYAYLMEALLDLGHEDMCKTAMGKLSSFQKESGAVPAYNNVNWVCSTGLFQLALVWFRLGKIERGNQAFDYACKLQNESGGWYGSYLSEENMEEENTYFPSAEISWANKYFLDALFYKNKAEFNAISSHFLKNISREDERYLVVKERIPISDAKVLDVGCGKGRYLRNLVQDLPNNEYYGVDISAEVMRSLSDINVKCEEGTLTCIPFEEKFFNVTYSCEAIEHSIDVERAIAEMVRVTKKDGLIIIIDKNDGCYGEFEIGEWEQWPNEEKLKSLMNPFCSDVDILHGLSYEDGENKDLFTAWIGKIR